MKLFVTFLIKNSLQAEPDHEATVHTQSLLQIGCIQVSLRRLCTILLWGALGTHTTYVDPLSASSIAGHAYNYGSMRYNHAVEEPRLLSWKTNHFPYTA